MKTIKMFALLTMVTMIFACSTEDEYISESIHEQGCIPAGKIVLCASASINGNTVRATYKDNNPNGITSVWSSGDTFKAYYKAYGSTTWDAYTFTLEGDAGTTTASFIGSNDNNVTSEPDDKGTWRAVIGTWMMNDNANSLTMSLGAQSGILRGLGNYDAQVACSEGTKAPAFSFSPVCAVMRIKLRSVRTAIKVVLDYGDRTSDNTAVPTLNLDLNSGTVTSTFTDKKIIISNNSFWLNNYYAHVIIPAGTSQNITSRIYYSNSTQGGKTIRKNATVEAGCVYNVDLSDVEIWDYVEMGQDKLGWAKLNLGAVTEGQQEGSEGGLYRLGFHDMQIAASGTSSPTISSAVLNSGFICGTDYDIVKANWQGTWRLPTSSEFDWILNSNKCSISHVSTMDWLSNSKSGLWLTSKTNGNMIYLPAGGGGQFVQGQAGYYWTGELYWQNNSQANYKYFIQTSAPNTIAVGYMNNRYSIRPVVDLID